MSADPVAWVLIEPGWDVLDSDGGELGKVHEVVGDADSDIFNGLTVSHGLLRPTVYVPSERVGRIFEGRVELELDASAYEALDETPPSSG